MAVRIQSEDFDLGAEVARLRAERADVGAIASFVGVVRDNNDGSSVGAMTLEHYPGMTQKALTNICDQALARFNITHALVIHRFGKLEPTDQIVLVVTAGGHRGDAFASCEFIMDFLKTEAPFWKKEETNRGSSWVEARESDNESARKWRLGSGH